MYFENKLVRRESEYSVLLVFKGYELLFRAEILREKLRFIFFCHIISLKMRHQLK